MNATIFRIVIAVGCCTLAAPARPGEATVAPPRPLPPELVESFTRSIQPLLLNRCATGGCHAGKTGHEPRLQRRNAAGHIDRELTLANIEAIRKGVGTPDQLRTRVASLAVAHPEGSRAPPLSQPQMNALRAWLVAAAEAEARPEQATGPAAAPAAPPNRFREMLRAANDPTPLWPAPQEPKGFILKNDTGDD